MLVFMGSNYVFSKKVPEVGDRGFIVGDRFIPIQNGSQKIPDDYVFYASFNGNTPDVAQTGQSLQRSGTVTYQEIDGIPCAYFDGNSYLYYVYSSDQLPKNSEPGSISFFGKALGFPNNGNTFVGYGASNIDNKNHRKMYFYRDEKFRVSNNSAGVLVTDYKISYNLWHHYCVTFNSSGPIISLYIDGVFQKSQSFPLNTDSSGNLCIGVDPWDLGKTYKLYGYISSVRIYNRVLSDLEIKLLSKEFKI